VHTTNQVVAIDRTVCHQCTPVCTSAVQDTHGIVKTDNDEVNVSDQCVGRLTVFQFIPKHYRALVH
jgi:hypothetical protein